MPNVIMQALQGLMDREDNLWPAELPTPPSSPAIYPRPLISDPALQRATTKLDKRFPTDMAGVDVQPMSWLNPSAGSNVLGSTDVKSGPQKIEVNPALSMAFPPSAIEHNLAHELEHVRQNRSTSMPALKALEELRQSYFDRPSEKAARDAAHRYDQETGAPTSWSADQKVLAALPKLPK